MKTPQMRQRPLLGGAFGQGQYSLASIPCVDNGLHSVRFLVLEHNGAVLATGDDKRAVLAEARRVLQLLHSEAANDAQWHQRQLWPELATTHTTAIAKPISRRRRQVFDRSEGRCFYCSALLTLDGCWHVEHQRPRALDGTDDPLNLVAACPSCNGAKGDRTAVEFVVERTRPTD
jgi:5-methylcytosine-specific restriction endonuclease McrA